MAEVPPAVEALAPFECCECGEVRLRGDEVGFWTPGYGVTCSECAGPNVIDVG
jgi:hypothetical protein